MNQREKADKYDILNCVMIADKCPKCSSDLEMSITSFKSLHLSKGLVYVCPYCYSELYIETVDIKELHNDNAR